jgi:hypothetical protein
MQAAAICCAACSAAPQSRGCTAGRLLACSCGCGCGCGCDCGCELASSDSAGSGELGAPEEAASGEAAEEELPSRGTTAAARWGLPASELAAGG